MKNLLTIWVVVFALVFMPVASYAEWLGGQSQDQRTMSPDKAMKSMEKPMEFRASAIIGKGVQNNEGEYMGVIRDLMIDPRDGGIAFAILSPGGVLGIPMKFVAVPFNALTFSSAKEIYLLDMSREKIAAAPSFDRGQWPQHANRAWETEMYRYYGQTPVWGESAETMTAGQGSAYRFTEIRGASVRNPEGEKLGFIRDLVIDSEGHVPDAVLSHGGFLGINAKLVAVSLSDLEFDAARHSFVLPWTKEKLDMAPVFLEGKLAGPSWTERAYPDYGPSPME